MRLQVLARRVAVVPLIDIAAGIDNRAQTLLVYRD
jgi:hypothetical protein